MSKEWCGFAGIFKISILEKSQLKISGLVSITILRLRLNYGFRSEPWAMRLKAGFSEEKISRTLFDFFILRFRLNSAIEIETSQFRFEPLGSRLWDFVSILELCFKSQLRILRLYLNHRFWNYVSNLNWDFEIRSGRWGSRVSGDLRLSLKFWIRGFWDLVSKLRLAY